MRRWLHCMIVALLCATLFMDSARACWHRRHSGRGCPPAAPNTACHSWPGLFVPDACPEAWVSAPLAWDGGIAKVIDCDRVVSRAVASEHVAWAAGDIVVVEGPSSQCCVPCDGSAHAVVHGEEVFEEAVGGDRIVEHDPVERGTTTAGSQPASQAEAVVVHEPTIVVGSSPAGPPQPSMAEIPAPKTARPAAPQPQLAAQEPLPDLKPATTPAAAGDQPVPASLDLPAEPAAPPAGDDKAMAEKRPQPATPDVDDLAAAPVKPAPAAETREPNYFDELADDSTDASEPAEPEMTEEEMADEPSADAESEADEPPAKKEPAPPAADEQPAAAPDADATVMIVPDEPMRRWTDATGDHHAQGWLAEVRDGEVRILKVNGRYTTMAVADLSDADQAYVASITARLAEQRQAAAAVNETAGL